MISLFPDKRKAIAGAFFISDSKTRNRCKKAYKKIQTWKFTCQENTVDEQYQEQINSLVHHSFFCMVSNLHVLTEENYFHQPLDN